MRRKECGVRTSKCSLNHAHGEDAVQEILSLTFPWDFSAVIPQAHEPQSTRHSWLYYIKKKSTLRGKEHFIPTLPRWHQLWADTSADSSTSCPRRRRHSKGDESDGASSADGEPSVLRPRGDVRFLNKSLLAHRFAVFIEMSQCHRSPRCHLKGTYPIDWDSPSRFLGTR